MTFLLNDPILIIQNEKILSGKFIEENEIYVTINIDNYGKCSLRKSDHIIELNYQEKLIHYLERSNRNNNYFKELYNYIVGF